MMLLSSWQSKLLRKIGVFNIKPHWAIILASFVLGSAAPLTATAQELCVKCTEPEMTYRCNVEPGSVGAGGLSIQLYCIRELARMGGHASCSVKRQSQATCDGEPRTLVFDAGTVPDAAPVANPNPDGGLTSGTQTPSAELPATAQPTQLTPPPIENGLSATQEPPVQPQPAAVPPKTDSNTPKTVEDLAKQAARSSKKQLDKAGRAVVGGVKSAGKTVNKAAKSTWRCLSSFFTDC